MGEAVCFIDASNIVRSGRMNYELDFAAFKDLVSRKCSNCSFLYYGAIDLGRYYQAHNWSKHDYVDLNKLELLANEQSPDAKKIGKQLGFLKKIEYKGYTVFCKPLKCVGGKHKGDCDINIAIHAMRLLRSDIDSFIFLSGDGDLLPLLREISKQGKQVQLFSFKNSTARELRQFLQGNWVNLGPLRDKFEYIKEKRPE